MNSPRSGGLAVIPLWFGALVVAGLWLLARPYVGLRHDGILYLGQALLHLHPAAFSKDIFFAYGSQDSFSVVSPVLAWMYATWGLDIVQIVVPTAAHVALLALLLVLLRPLPALDRWLGLAATAVLSHVYGGYNIFAFAERFLTGRTLAEPLALAAIVLAALRRPVLALLLIVPTAAMHPLVALPAMTVVWLMLCLQDRRWLWLVLLAAAPVLLALVGTKPFTSLLQTYDAAWWSGVEGSNGQVLMSLWRWTDWQTVLLDVGVLAVAARLLPQPLNALAIATIVATGLLLGVSVVGADLLHNVLLTQLQVWRVLWLTRLFALVLLPAVWLWAWRRGPAGRLAALALATAVVAVNGMWDSGWALLLWAAGTWWLMRRPVHLSAAMQRLATLCTVIALLGLSAAVTGRVATLLMQPGGSLDDRTVLLLAFTLPTISMPIAAALLLSWQRGRAALLLATALAGVGAAYGASAWDRRSPETRYLETSLTRSHPFQPFIPETAQVYWHEAVASTWMLLKRPNYYSVHQGAGLLFSRDTAIEYARRRDAFAALKLQVEVCRLLGALNGDKHDAQTCVPTREVVEDLCRYPQGPDFLVFERDVGKGVVAQWRYPSASAEDPTYYLYDCIQLR